MDFVKEWPAKMVVKFFQGVGPKVGRCYLTNSEINLNLLSFSNSLRNLRNQYDISC